MAIQNDKENCITCRFFSLGDRSMGVCQRYPTSVNTSSGGWCGEWAFQISLSIDAMVQSITDPIEVTEAKKGRGRPKKA
jgi:hypothetical protein